MQQQICENKSLKSQCEKQKDTVEFLTKENAELKKTIHSLESQLSLTLFRKDSLDLSDKQEDPVSVIMKLQHDIAESTLMNTKCHAVISNLLVHLMLFEHLYRKKRVKCRLQSIERLSELSSTQNIW